jgi:7,8-dihydropterin-6-yl-methyl-4-(beta-D-ribofuranosyl)aminobenzene 5'-phosphate synthase
MDKLKIEIMYDNRALKNFKHGWGFSALIEVKNKNILFDTGAGSEILFHNMKKFNYSPDHTDIIVISHSHFDHSGGLPHILGLKDDIDVYLPKYMNSRSKSEFKMYGSSKSKFYETDGRKIIIEDIIEAVCTRELYEQFLLIHLKEGLLILTGCAHPGLGNDIDYVQKIGTIYGVMGGFHGFSNMKKLKGIQFLAPCHCTSYLDEIKYEFKENFVECVAGSEFEFDLK